MPHQQQQFEGRPALPASSIHAQGRILSFFLHQQQHCCTNSRFPFTCGSAGSRAPCRAATRTASQPGPAQAGRRGGRRCRRQATQPLGSAGVLAAAPAAYTREWHGSLQNPRQRGRCTPVVCPCPRCCCPSTHTHTHTHSPPTHPDFQKSPPPSRPCLRLQVAGEPKVCDFEGAPRAGRRQQQVLRLQVALRRGGKAGEGAAWWEGAQGEARGAPQLRNCGMARGSAAPRCRAAACG